MKAFKRNKKLLVITLAFILVCTLAAAFLYIRNQDEDVKDVKVSSNVVKVELFGRKAQDLGDGLAFYSSFQSAADGNDICVVFDKNTDQRYAMWFYDGGFSLEAVDNPDNGTTYYTNDTVSQKDAIKLLYKNCRPPYRSL